MLEYREKAVLLVTGTLGIMNNMVLDPGPARSELEIAVAQVATRCLPDRLRRTFYYLFACQKNWDAVAERFNARAQRTVDVDSIRRYSNEALEALRLEARSASEFTVWRKRYAL